MPTFFDLTTPAIVAHAAELKKKFADWKEPSGAQVLRFETRQYFTNDDDPKTAETKVTLRVRLAQLPLSAAARAYVRVLSRTRYNADRDELKLTCNWFGRGGSCLGFRV